MKADFSFLRYAQCWEDADVLLEALDVGPDSVCLSIASAGENSFSLLSRGPRKVVAVDLNAAQLAAVKLRIAAYRGLEHHDLLQLIGSRPASPELRHALYQRCRPQLDDEARSFWDAHPEAIDGGIGGAGKFENYFRLFRTRVLPLVHTRREIQALLTPKDRESRIDFYEKTWNNLRWRLLFKAFFSRFAMGRLGRDPAFFDYVEGSVSDRILSRVHHALTELDPSVNPYAYWILTGTHGDALPHALRPENVAAIRDNLDRLELHQASIGALLDTQPELRVDRFNLSDIFEYLSEDETKQLYERLLDAANPGARLAYWNMLAPRVRPASVANVVRSLDALAHRLHLEDKAFFYSRFVVEEYRPSLETP